MRNKRLPNNPKFSKNCSGAPPPPSQPVPGGCLWTPCQGAASGPRREQRLQAAAIAHSARYVQFTPEMPNETNYLLI